MKDEKRFYVYVYLDPRKPGKYVYGKYEFDHEPFYVGKGCKRRWKVHLTEAKYSDVSNYRLNKIRKIWKLNLEPIVIKYKNKINENESYKLEFDLVDKIGRIIKNNGPLVNITDGGEEFSGLQNESNGRWKNIDENELLKLYDSGMPIENIAIKTETSIPLIRRRLKYWDVEKRSNINIGTERTDGCKRKISDSKKGRFGELNANHKYSYTFISPNKKEYKFKDINNFCIKFNLNYGSIRKSFKRQDEFYKKWKIERELIK